jgi:hypothetical protein
MYNNLKLLKMKKSSKVILGLLLIIGMNVTASAQENESTNKTNFSIEIDPSTFAFKGYAVHLRIQPKNSRHLLVGAGVYAMDFPDLIVDLNPKNKNKGWDVRLNQGVGLFGEYHFSEVNKKWFVGAQLALQEYEIEKADEVDSGEFNTFLGLGYGGYTIQPFKNNGFYIKTWMGAGYTTQSGGKNILGDLEYDVSPILLFAAVHFGYTF